MVLASVFRSHDLSLENAISMAIPLRLLPHLVRLKGNGHNIGQVIMWEGEAIENIKTASKKCSQTSKSLRCVFPYVEAHSNHSVDALGMYPFKVPDFLATSAPNLLNHFGHHNPDHQDEVAPTIGARPNSLKKWCPYCYLSTAYCKGCEALQITYLLAQVLLLFILPIPYSRLRL